VAFSNPVTGAQGALIRPAIKSPNYAPGVLGWSINRDGSAEFNNLTIRGTFFGTSYILNTAGAFFYSGTPAAGNLILSIAVAAGTDTFGNAYVRGLGTYAASVNTYQLDATTGNVSIGATAAAHWLFDVANARLSLFDQNNALSAQFNALSTNSIYYWLENTTKQYFAATAIGIQIGALTTAGAIPTAQDSANAASLNLNTPSPPALSIKGLAATADPGSVAAVVNLQSGSAGATVPGGPNNPRVQILANGGNVADIALRGGALYRSDLTGVQIPTMTAGFTNIDLKYYIDGQDKIVAYGAFSMNALSAGAGAAVVTTAAPAAYWPALSQRFSCGWLSAGSVAKGSAIMAVNSNGTYSLIWPAATAAGDRFEFCVSVPLGNLP
jgi:hypothetical protein